MALAPEDPPIDVVYKNHRGETAVRSIIPLRVFYGQTDFHREPQWLLHCYDVDREAERTYALQDCNFAHARSAHRV